MTASPFQTIALVQLVPDGEWLVAIPAPNQSGDPSHWAVDVYKDLTFNALKTTAELTAMQDVPPLNRFVPIKLELIPALNEASPFALLSGLIRAVLPDSPEEELTPQEGIAALTLYSLLRAMGRGLHEALTAKPEREETLYAAHDFIAYGLQARMRAAGVSATDHGEDETASWSMTEEEE